jgi:hypothetical protein
MPKAKLHPLFKEIRGTVGGLVFKRSNKGEVIIAQRPRKPSAEPSEAQKAHRQRFKEAAAYAKAALADPTIRAYYEEQALQLKKPPYSLAVGDYMQGTNLLRNEPALPSFDPGI